MNKKINNMIYTSSHYGKNMHTKQYVIYNSTHNQRIYINALQWLSMAEKGSGKWALK